MDIYNFPKFASATIMLCEKMLTWKVSLEPTNSYWFWRCLDCAVCYFFLYSLLKFI